jgi:hypothetical protein
VNPTANNTKHELSEPGRISTQSSRRNTRLLRRGCLFSIVAIAAIIGVPAFWWMSAYAPVTLFQVHGTLEVTSDTGECGRWDTTVWPLSSPFSAAEAVDASSEGDLWVGAGMGKILRGNGRKWRHVQTLTTNDGKQVNVRRIDVLDDNAWVLSEFQENSYSPGSYQAAREPWRSALFRWNGTDFEQVAIPGLDHSLARVHSMTVVAADDAWFVGSAGRIWHWNGKEIVAVEPADRDIKRFDLKSISAVSPEDIWAVGTLAGQAYGEAVAAHWDGKAWEAAKKWGGIDWRETNEQIIYLWDVLAIANDDVWATGGNKAVHWDGREWKKSEMPSFEEYGDVLFSSITASSSDDVWALGYAGEPRPFAVHWDGSKWSVIPAPRPLNLGSFHESNAFPGKLWVAGSAYQDEDLGPVYTMSAEFKSSPCR